MPATDVDSSLDTCKVVGEVDRKTIIDLRSSSFDPLPPRAKIGVKMSGSDERELVPPRDCLFTTYSEELYQARQDYRSSIRFSEELIAGFESGDPDATLIQVQRMFGASTTIAAAIEREWTSVAEVWAMLEEVEETPLAHEEDLLYVLSYPPGYRSPDGGQRPLYDSAFKHFNAVHRIKDSGHVAFLVSRAAMEGEMSFFGGQRIDDNDHWDGRRWRTGDGDPVTLSVDPADLIIDYTPIDREELVSDQIVESSLYTAMKVAAIVDFHARVGRDNESPRAYWQHWLDRELSLLSQMTGIDYELVVGNGALPTAAVVARWESEVNVLDSEDQAKLRHWEAVCHYWNVEGYDDRAAEEVEWAEYVEGEAEETRLWAVQKRERLLSERRRSHRQHRHPVAVRRFGTARARQSRGRSFRCGGSRRVTSRSAGGGSSGDSDESGGSSDPPRPQHHLSTGYRFERPATISQEAC